MARLKNLQYGAWILLLVFQSSCSSEKAQELANSAVDAASQNKYGQAETLLKEAIVLDPNNSDLYKNLGMVYKTQAKYSEAANMFELSAKIKPAAKSYYEAGLAYKAQNKLLEALSCVEKALLAIQSSGEKTEKKDDNLLAKIEFLKGTLAYARKDFTVADSAFRAAIKADSSLHPALLELGRLYYNEGHFCAAAKVYEVANTVLTDGDVFLQQGISWRRCKNYDKSIVALEKAAKATPRTPYALHHLGLTYECKGDTQKAIESYELFGAQGLSPELRDANMAKIKELKLLIQGSKKS